MLELLLRIRKLRAGAAVAVSTSRSTAALPRAADIDGSDSERMAGHLQLGLDVINSVHDKHLTRDKGTRSFL